MMYSYSNREHSDLNFTKTIDKVFFLHLILILFVYSPQKFHFCFGSYLLCNMLSVAVLVMDKFFMMLKLIQTLKIENRLRQMLSVFSCSLRSSELMLSLTVLW